MPRKTTYTFEEYVELCCTVSSWNELNILTELLEKEALLFTEEEMLFLCDMAEAKNNSLIANMN